MFHVSLYEDVEITAKPYVHPTGVGRPSVHVEFGPENDRRLAYVDITPDQADKLAAELTNAAQLARAADREREAVGAAIARPDTIIRSCAETPQ